MNFNFTYNVAEIIFFSFRTYNHNRIFYKKKKYQLKKKNHDKEILLKTISIFSLLLKQIFNLFFVNKLITNIISPLILISIFFLNFYFK